MPVRLTIGQISDLCQKYDIKFGSERFSGHYRLFIQSYYFWENGWKKIFDDGYYNSFVRMAKENEEFIVVRQSHLPIYDKDTNAYCFQGNEKLSTTYEEFEQWIEKKVKYVRQKLPLIHKKRICKQKLNELKKDFV